MNVLFKEFKYPVILLPLVSGMEYVELIGNMAALGTATLWAFNALLFTKAGKRLGAMPLNALRIAMAAILLFVTHLILYRSPLPDATLNQVVIIAFSGFLGLAVGDFFYFSTLLYLGPRRASLVMGSWPIFAAILAFIFLGETLGWPIILGIVLVTVGTTWVILERKPKEGNDRERLKLGKKEKKLLMMGVFTGILGSFCQAIGYVYAKKGMFIDGGLDPLPTTLIRMIAAMAMVWVIVLALGNWKKIKSGVRDFKGMGFAFGGTVCGPFLGVWLSMVAAHATKIGVASTLMSLTPILIIPIVMIADREKISLRSIGGAAMAFLGVAILFLGTGVENFVMGLF
jgi:drug/metabolite transporter (DMT)-like permease